MLEQVIVLGAVRRYLAMIRPKAVVGVVTTIGLLPSHVERFPETEDGDDRISGFGDLGHQD